MSPEARCQVLRYKDFAAEEWFEDPGPCFFCCVSARPPVDAALVPRKCNATENMDRQGLPDDTTGSRRCISIMRG